MTLIDFLRNLTHNAIKGDPIEAQKLTECWISRCEEEASKGYFKVDVYVGGLNPKDTATHKLAVQNLKDRGLASVKFDDRYITIKWS